LTERAERVAAPLVVLAAAALSLAPLFEQVRHPEPFLNDGVLHYGLIECLAGAHERGQSLLDPWVRAWTLGFPLFHYYQNLPHLLVLALAKVSFGTLSLLAAFRVLEWLALGTLPLPVFVALRRFGFRPLAAAAGAMLALWPKTDYLHGADLESYTWQGLGLFTQAVGMWFFPLALAWVFGALREGRGLAAAAWLCTATVLSHLVLGWLVFVFAAVIALLSPKELPARLRRLAVVALVTAAATSYLAVPMLRDYTWHHMSDLVPTWKYDSFGHAVALQRLASGALFDFERLPVLTVLLAAGLVWLGARTALFALRRISQSEGERTLLALFAVSLALYFGRPTWGGLLDLVPLGGGLHWSRLLAAVHLLGCAIAGVGAAELLLRLSRRGGLGAAAALVLAAAAVFPLAKERTAYLLHNAELVREAAAGLEAEREDLDRALALAAQDTNGRVYAGQGRAGGHTWGGQFLVGWVPVYDFPPLRQMDSVTYLHHMASMNSDLHDAFDERNPADYRAFNVRRIIAPPDVRFASFASEIGSFGRFRVLAVDGPGFVELVDVPYAVDVPRENVARTHVAWLRRLAPLGIHPEVRLTEGPPASYDVRFPDSALPDSPRGEVLRVERSGDDFTAVVRADRPCHAVLKMTFHPGWRARVDGRPEPTMHVLPSYLAVPLAAGRHTVEFSWEPGPLKEILAAGGLLVLAGFTLVAGRIR
jgi:hypothetical protein